MSSRRILYPIAILFITGVVALSIGCGGKKTPTGPIITEVPESWGGVWSVRTRMKLCGTSAYLVDTTIVQTLCPGESFNSLFGSEEELCPGGTLAIRQSGATFSCSQPFNSDGCTGTTTVNFTTTVSGSSSTGTGKVQVRNQAPSAQCPDLCFDISMTGTRIQSTPASCDTATAAPGGNPWNLWRAALARR